VPAKEDNPPTPVEVAVNHYTVREIVRRVKPFVTPHRWRLRLAITLIVLTGVAFTIPPIFTKFMIDEALPARSIKLALGAAAIFLMAMALRMVLWYIASMIVLYMREVVLFQLRSTGFRHLQRLCLRFHNRYPSGMLYDRLFERSICYVGGFLTTLFSNVALYITGFVFSLVVCLYQDYRLTIVIFVGAVGHVTIARIMSPRIRKKTLECSDAHNWIAGYILDKLRGTKTIQAFALEDHTQADFDRRVWPMQQKYIMAHREGLRLGFVSEGIGYLTTAMIFVMGAYAVFNWHKTPGDLMLFVGYQAQLTNTIRMLTNVYGQSAVARAGFDQIFTVLDTRSTIAERPDSVMPTNIKGDLEFSNVSFAYEQKPVLSDLNLKIPAGQTIALVGRSGGGKSTVANMLLRFYDPDSGSILLDGTDIRSMPIRQYRSQFGVVLQDPFLFDDTIAGNLRCARPDATDEQIIDALERACALDFVEELSAGIHHRVGEAGGRLSGGQRQRIAVARCMLLRPRFLILDEATSALDNESERYVQQAFDALFEGRTVFIIAHRLSTIRGADRILVVDNGRLVEDGSFEELLDQQGVFHRLYTIATSSSARNIKLDEAGFA